MSSGDDGQQDAHTTYAKLVNDPLTRNIVLGRFAQPDPHTIPLETLPRDVARLFRDDELSRDSQLTDLS